MICLVNVIAIIMEWLQLFAAVIYKYGVYLENLHM